jgi:hypothetical protein
MHLCFRSTIDSYPTPPLPGRSYAGCLMFGGAEEWRDVYGTDAWRLFIERNTVPSSRNTSNMGHQQFCGVLEIS